VDVVDAPAGAEGVWAAPDPSPAPQLMISMPATRVEMGLSRNTVSSSKRAARTRTSRMVGAMGSGKLAEHAAGNPKPQGSNPYEIS